MEAALYMTPLWWSDSRHAGAWWSEAMAGTQGHSGQRAQHTGHGGQRALVCRDTVVRGRGTQGHQAPFAGEMRPQETPFPAAEGGELPSQQRGGRVPLPLSVTLILGHSGRECTQFWAVGVLHVLGYAP